MPAQDLYDRVATSLSDWLQQTPPRIAEAWMGGGRAPFAAPTTERDRYEFYESRFFLPDGSPNVPGRQQELDRLGVASYAQTMRAVMQRRAKGALAAVDQQEPAPATPPAPQEGYT
jgi:hypothetical protein